MTTELRFPVFNKCPNKFYYRTYCAHVRLTFEMINANIILDPQLNYLGGSIFYIKINNKLALIDFSDYHDECSWTYINGFRRTGKLYNYEDINVPIFKRTMIPNWNYPNNVYPYGPFWLIDSVEEYKEFLNLKQISVNKIPTKILHTNRLYGGSQLTRKIAFKEITPEKLLSEVRFDKRRVDRKQHLKRLKNCIASLEIGACPHAQGSGAIEAFLAGTPVISNDMDILLPHNKSIQKNKHYIYVEEDYSNINEAINYAYSNRKEALENAEKIYELFLNTWHPQKLTKWMEQVVEEWYG